MLSNYKRDAIIVDHQTENMVPALDIFIIEKAPMSI